MRWLNIIIVVTLCMLVFQSNVKGQPIAKDKKQDTIKQNVHSPKKATYLAIIPGAGQIYNKKYWKLPIVYAGFGVIGYFAISNRNLYKEYGDAYACKVENPNCNNILAQKYSKEDLITIRDYYRRNMELSFIIMGGWYILQIIDAMVDANLYNWEINSNLSVSVQPVINPPLILKQPPFNGLHITISF